LFIFLPASCLFASHYVFAQTDQTSKIQEANSAVEQAFNAVLSAEQAGANVTALLKQLNYASSLLAQSENAYRDGVNGTATNDASSVFPITQQIITQAQDAKEAALASEKNAFWSMITTTIIAAAVFVVALFLVWRLLKRNYIKGLSEAKPEVANQ
jgi:hypothetical protein